MSGFRDLTKKEISTEQPNIRWSIDLDWYQQNDRSFSLLAQSQLCDKCIDKLNIGGKENPPDKLIATIQDCCSKNPDFITEQLPISGSIFRLFLANGNQPLDLEELGSQLSSWRGVDTYRTSPEVLSRILQNDQYYGLRETGN